MAQFDALLELWGAADYRSSARLGRRSPERLRVLVVVAAGSGFRPGELLGLGPKQVDFLRRSIKVERRLLTVGGETLLGDPKSESSRRVVPVPTLVVDALSNHMQHSPAGDLLFTTPTGQPWRRNHFSDAWRRIVAAAGLPTGTRLHALRHYYASLLIRHGESVKTVQMRLGHASASETLNTYADLWPDSDDRTREAVEAVLASAFADTPRPARGLDAP